MHAVFCLAMILGDIKEQMCDIITCIFIIGNFNVVPQNVIMGGSIFQSMSDLSDEGNLKIVDS